MDLGAFGSRKGTLAAFVIIPIVIVVGCAAPAFVYFKRVESDCDRRARLLQVAGDMEKVLQSGQDCVAALVARGPAAGDMNAELTQLANEIGQKSGFAVQSVTVNEQPVTGAGIVAPGLVHVKGSGTLPQLLRFIDAFESQSHRFKIVDLKLGAGTLQPAVYEATCDIMAVQFKAPRFPAASRGDLTINPVPGMRSAGDRLARAAAALNAMAFSRPTLRIEDAKVASTVTGDSSPSAVFGELRLYGVVQKAANPLALTDQGVKGIGETVDGGTIAAIDADSVTVVDGKGQRHVVRLYAEAPR